MKFFINIFFRQNNLGDNLSHLINNNNRPGNSRSGYNNNHCEDNNRYNQGIDQAGISNYKRGGKR